ncbi:variable surface protein [Plasmodium gonderi]|uniref:Variable surface protein n=1 Tax=Plasmodium gonderi TaxID=77519 RepID=A0A1Y1JMN5_PLAGO|nr:variable surface protein [Plasmodium gonderi]GAW82735.1 variable surface protein [Plasmodium gonderi]
MSDAENDIWDIVLKKTQSGTIYDELNKEIDEINYKEVCKLLNIDKENEDGYFKLCKKIARNAEYLSKLSNTDAYKYRCSHYRYWFYNELYKLLKNNEEISNIKNVIKNFMNIQKYIVVLFEFYDCHYNFYTTDITELKEKLEEKHLYDYFQNFFTIKSVETCKLVELFQYTKYLNEIKVLYTKHKHEKNCCFSLWWNNCPNYFYCNDDYNPEKILSSLKLSNSENCENMNKPNDPENHRDPQNPQSSEDIMDTFHYAKCTDTSDDRLICNLYPVKYKSPHSASYRILPLDNNKGKDIKTIVSLFLPHEESPKNTTHTEPNDADQNPESSSQKKYFITVSGGSTIRRDAKDKKVYPFNYKRTEEQKEKLQFPSEKKESLIKWKFGNGTVDCSNNNTTNDRYKLCQYIKNIRVNQRYLKDKYAIGSKVKYFKSTFPYSMQNVNVAKNIDGSITYESDGSNVTKYFDSDENYIEISEDKNNILYTMFFRVSVVSLLTLGFIVLFIVYYKYTSLGSWLRKRIMKKKRINESVHRYHRKTPPSGSRKFHTKTRYKPCCIVYETT